MSSQSPNYRKIIIAGITSFIILSCVAHYKTTHENFIAVKKTASVERGKNLVENICAGCHRNYEVQTYIGNHMGDLPRILGKIYSANLTHSSLFGVLEKYSDAEIVYLLKTGTAKDGRYIPYMLKPMLADEDINDMIVYLRSKDSPLQAVDTSVGKTHMSIFGKIGVRLTGKPKPYIKGIPLPDEDNPAIYGHYLIGTIGCYHCHSKSALGLDYVNPERSKGFMAGGMRFKDENGNRIHAANLTPDKETGIGKYSKEDFRKAVRDGITPEKKKLHSPMGQFQALTDKQVDAIYAYLYTLPAKHHAIKKH